MSDNELSQFGINLYFDNEKFCFQYGHDSFGPISEIRHLNDIRQSLLDYNAQGPDKLYSISMDVGEKKDQEDLVNRGLLFGVVAYAKGKIGKEPVRSQGHIHSVSASTQYSTPEVYEIWNGEATILMQEYAKDNPGRVYAVRAQKGDVVIVPPNWAHCTINSGVKEQLVFGAWCIRDFGFDYDEVRAHNGLAYYPTVGQNDEINWIKNDKYNNSELIEKSPEDYSNLNINQQMPIYKQYQEDHERFNFVTKPKDYMEIWKNFTP